MPLTFKHEDTTDHNDRIYTAAANGAEFRFCAQYWDVETGEFDGTGNDVWVNHGGIKNYHDPAQRFTDSPDWDAFEAASGVEPRAFRIAFEELVSAEFA